LNEALDVNYYRDSKTTDKIDQRYWVIGSTETFK